MHSTHIDSVLGRIVDTDTRLDTDEIQSNFILDIFPTRNV